MQNTNLNLMFAELINKYGNASVRASKLEFCLKRLLTTLDEVPYTLLNETDQQRIIDAKQLIKELQ